MRKEVILVWQLPAGKKGGYWNQLSIIIDPSEIRAQDTPKASPGLSLVLV